MKTRSSSAIVDSAGSLVQGPGSLAGLTLLYSIGRGAYGEVWLARSVTGAMRAVKIVRRNCFEHARPFEREFQAIQKFEPVSRAHRSQVDILHVGRADDYFFYVMELADDQATGGQIKPEAYTPRTLKSDLLNKGRLPFDECVSVALSLTAALQNLHENGLVHRDVKPSNIIYVNGVAKLADVGLVTSIDATRSFVGTEGFAAPEGPGAVQADIYSLGKVIYEMATGKDRQDFPELPAELREMPDRAGLVELNSVIVKACRHNPAERYETAAQMREELELLQSGKSIARLHALRAKLKWAVCAAALLTIGIILITAVWIYHARQTSALLKLAEEKARLANENAALTEFKRLQLMKEGVFRASNRVVLFIGGPITNAANGHIYYLLGSARPSWAEACAISMGGALATIRNAQEQSWIYDTFGNWNGIPRNLLIGLYHPDPAQGSRDKEARRTEFRWKSKERVSYQNWGPPEPNAWERLEERYVHMWAPTLIDPGMWNDCSDTETMLGCGMHGVVEIVAPSAQRKSL